MQKKLISIEIIIMYNQLFVYPTFMQIRKFIEIRIPLYMYHLLQYVVEINYCKYKKQHKKHLNLYNDIDISMLTKTVWHEHSGILG
jgi:hypothetical protein